MISKRDNVRKKRRLRESVNDSLWNLFDPAKFEKAPAGLSLQTN
jgi:hypothetical protein